MLFVAKREAGFLFGSEFLLMLVATARSVLRKVCGQKQKMQPPARARRVGSPRPGLGLRSHSRAAGKGDVGSDMGEVRGERSDCGGVGLLLQSDLSPLQF